MILSSYFSFFSYFIVLSAQVRVESEKCKECHKSLDQEEMPPVTSRPWPQSREQAEEEFMGLTLFLSPISPASCGPNPARRQSTSKPGEIPQAQNPRVQRRVETGSFRA